MGRMRIGWLASALAAITVAASGQAPSMPSWLADFPGVTAQRTISGSLLEATYSAPVKPAAVIEHYRKLFEAQDLPFNPSFDGMGTVVRGTAAECDLLIAIRAQGSATVVRVDCAGKQARAETWTALPDAKSRMPAGTLARHQQLVKDLNIHPVYHDAPAPPLVWPDWLVHVKGGRLTTQAGVDRASHRFLRSKYVTAQPMTEVYAFYEDLLNANGYPVHSSKLGTGQTISGIVQNATGHVEGHNYPNGFPGPYTEIHVEFWRSHLNDPITVDLKFTTYEFKAPPPFGQ